MRFALYHTGEELCIDGDGSWCDPNDPYLEGIFNPNDSLEIFDIIEIATGYKFSEIFKEILLLDVSNLDFEDPVWEGSDYEHCVEARCGLLKTIKELYHKYYEDKLLGQTSSGTSQFIVTYANTSTSSN